MSKKAKLLYIILLISLFLTGYQFSKRMRAKKDQPVSQSYSHSVSIRSVDAVSFILKDAA